MFGFSGAQDRGPCVGVRGEQIVLGNCRDAISVRDAAMPELGLHGGMDGLDPLVCERHNKMQEPGRSR